ncbi:MAG: two-component regulator propeller domain-containing protein [Xanthomonadales bacterium]|nr:two-component regulator propeller domain-containing protein [Xanthomonadales bacterium]
MGAAITAITGLALAAGLGPGALPPGEPLFQRLGIEQGLPSSAVNAIAQDRDGYLWIATSDGLARFDGLGFELWRAGAGEPPLPGNEVQALAATAEGFLWLAFEDRGIARLDPAARRLRHFPPGRGGAPANDVWAILEDREGAVWLGTWQEGLIRFHPERGRLAEHRHRPGDPESLPSDVVIQLARGRGGELLVATAEGFARLRDPGRGRFEVLRHGPEPGQGLAAPMVIGVHEDADGSLWIGTSAGVDLLRGGRLLRQGDPGHPLAALPPLRAQGFLRSGDGTLWLGTQDGVARLGPEGLAWHRGEEERRFALPRAGVVQLLEDHEGGLWFATRGGGLARLRPGWRNFAVFRHRAGDPASLPAAAVHAVVEDASGALWALAARGGLWRLDRESGRGERVLPEGWPDLPQLSLAADPAGGLWIGFHHGLARLDPATGRLELARLGEPGGLPRGAYSLLLASAPGEVWAAAYGIGLFRIGPGFALREEVRPGGPQGLPGADFEQLARGPEGGLWVAGAHGLVRLAEPGRGLEAHQVFAGERVFAFDFAADGRLWLALEDRIVRLGAEGEKAFGDATGYEAVRAGSLFVGEDGRVWVATPRGLLALDPRDGRFTRYGLGDGLPTLELSARPGFRAQDGSLWLPTQDGLVGFRPGALRRPEVPPPLRLVELSVQRGGRRVALDPGGAVLQAEDRELKVGVRALSYRRCRRQPLPLPPRRPRPGLDRDRGSGRTALPAAAAGTLAARGRGGHALWRAQRGAARDSAAGAAPVVALAPRPAPLRPRGRCSCSRSPTSAGGAG